MREYVYSPSNNVQLIIYVNPGKTHFHILPVYDWRIYPKIYMQIFILHNIILYF
jgi:hypothetical protein